MTPAADVPEPGEPGAPGAVPAGMRIVAGAPDEEELVAVAAVLQELVLEQQQPHRVAAEATRSRTPRSWSRSLRRGPWDGNRWGTP